MINYTSTSRDNIEIIANGVTANSSLSLSYTTPVPNTNIINSIYP